MLRCSTSSRTAYRSRRLFYKSHRSLIPSLLLSKPDPLRWAPVWFAALRAALFLDLCVFFVNTCQNKRTSLRMSFCFGFRRPESGFTLGISMLGVGKAAPAQFPACGRKFTRHSARGPEGPFYLFRPPASFSSAQNTSVQAHSVAPPLQTGPASLGSGLVCRPAGGLFL